MKQDELDYLNSGVAPSEQQAALRRAVALASQAVPGVAIPVDACGKCKGSGRFVSYSGRDVGPCFTCNGTGKARSNEAAAAALHAALHAEMAKPENMLVPLDISTLPSGTYAVPGGDTRLKVRVKRPGKQSKWYGYIFVDDGAVYGQGKRYGRQAPNGKYVGIIEDQLRAIMADPYGAVTAYGKLTGTCGVCGRHLEDAESVAKGIGPICEGRYDKNQSEQHSEDHDHA